MKLFLRTLVLSFLVACTNQNPDSKNKLTKEYTEENVYVEEWMDLIYYHVKHQIVGPPSASRMYGYLGISVYESLVHGMPEFKSMKGQVNDLEELPVPEDGKIYDWPTVMCETLYHVSDEMLSHVIAGKDTSLNSLYNKQLKDRKKHVEPDTYNNSLEFGKALAKALVKWSEGDGYNDIQYLNYVNPSRLGHPERYEATDINQDPLQPFWGKLRPMAIANSNICPQALSFEFSIDTASTFYKQAFAVLEADANLTEEKRQIVLYWADCPGETATPPGHWTQMMNSAIKSNNLNLEQTAHMYGLVSIGIFDAFIQCWFTKYDINLVRPKTYINENIPGGETWEPYVITPPFPEFVSGHSVVSGCASELLTEILGDSLPFVDSTHYVIGLEPRKFNSFREAAEEAAMSRLYGGMHYPAANSQGLEQGRCIANNILKTVQFKTNTQI